MKYSKMPRLLWLVFRRSFKRELPRMTEESPERVMRAAAIRYQEILAPIPEFDSDDRFLVNILSASMLAAVYMELKEKPNLEEVTDFYHHAMTDNFVMKKFLKKKGSYTVKGQAKLARQAEASQTRSNLYSWKFEYIPGKDINSYTVNFSTCGIKYLFVTREYTLAGGGPCCDCHYQKAENQC